MLMVAAGVGLLPWFPGPGWLWSLILAVGGVLFFRQFSIGDPQHPQHALWSGAFTVLVFAHSWQLLYPGVGALPWLAASGFLLASQWKQLDFVGVKRGYRLYVALGAVVGLLTLWGTWGVISGWYMSWWMGGMQYNSVFNAFSGQHEMQLQYNPMQIPMSSSSPDIPYSGQSQPGALWAEITLFALLAWSLRPLPTLSTAWRTVALGSIVLLLLWSFNPMRDGYRAPTLFFLVMLVAGFGAWKLSQGQTQGDFDPNDVQKRVKTKIGAR